MVKTLAMMIMKWWAESEENFDDNDDDSDDGDHDDQIEVGVRASYLNW